MVLHIKQTHWHTSETSLRKLYWKDFNRFQNCTDISPHWIPLHEITLNVSTAYTIQFLPSHAPPISSLFLTTDTNRFPPPPSLSLPLIRKTDGPKGRRKIPTKWHFTRKKKGEKKVKLYVCELRPTCNFIRVFFLPLDWCRKKTAQGKVQLSIVVHTGSCFDFGAKESSVEFS